LQFKDVDGRDKPGHGNSSVSTSTDSALAEKTESEQTDHDQIYRDNEVQQTGHDKNKNAGDYRDNGLQVPDADGHDESPRLNGNQTERRDRPGSSRQQLN
jgi:hypothetical protein